MSLRSCITNLASSFWVARRHTRPQVLFDRRVEQRFIGTLLLPIELQETISSEVAKRLRNYHAELKIALDKKNIDDIYFNLTSSRREFFALPREAWKFIRENHLQLTKGELEEIGNTLSGRLKKGEAVTAAAAVGQLIRDAKAMYGIDPSADMFLTALNALIRTKQQLEAYDLFRLVLNYKVKPFRLTSQHWYITMRGLSQIGEVDNLKECLSLMKKSLPFPGNVHYHALLLGLYRRAEPPSVDEVLEILDDLQRLNFPFSDEIYNTLGKVGQSIGRDSLPAEYEEKCNARHRPSDVQVEEWLNKLLTYRKRARAAFETKLIAFRNEGFFPDERTLSKYVQISSLTSPDELIYLHETLELPPSVHAWSICIRNTLEKNGWRRALEAYEVARAQGIKPTAAMIDPLLRSMCSKFVNGPPEQALDKALELYEDLNEHAKASGGRGADTALFNILLRALVSSENKRKFFPIALKLLQDMREQGVFMDRMTASSVAVLLVRSSSTYEEAAEAYKQVHNVNAEGLDAKGFVAVLHAFCSLEVSNTTSDTSVVTPAEDPSENSSKDIEPSLSIPPTKLYFDIVQVMYAHGFHKSVEVYTILLGRYATLATRTRGIRDAERRDRTIGSLRSAIRETHHQMSLEAGLVPDAALWNQLMDTYNRAGLFRDVMQTWTTLNSTGLVTPAGVSIVFDACGFQRDSQHADAIFRDLKEQGFKLNRRNWNSWVECLCRTGRLDEALAVVCYEMKNAKDPEVRPDVHTIQLLRSFGIAHGRIEEVQLYLKRHLPSLSF